MAPLPGAGRSSVQTYTFNDFTPGIHSYVAPSNVGAHPLQPPGSAAVAFRCYARENIGLMPLPAYRPVQQYTSPAFIGVAPQSLSMGNMKTLAGRGGGIVDIVSTYLAQGGTGFGSPTVFTVARCHANTFTTNSVTTLYTASATQFPQNTTSWPTMDYGVFLDPTTQVYSRTVITTDPMSTSPTTASSGNGTWITVRGWTTPAGTPSPDISTGTFPLVSTSYPRIFYHGNRMGIWQVNESRTVDGFLASDVDTLQVSNHFDPTVITEVGPSIPELGTIVSSWGSISQGEYLGIYTEGGAFTIYGDLFRPDSTQRLPGVTGTGGINGPAAATPIGLIYPRYNGHAYLWNGDNTSSNISPQIPAGQLQRTVQGNGFGASPAIMGSNAVWGDWVSFPNNWLFDILTNGWWQIEDPTILSFDVVATANGVNLVAAPGVVYTFDGTPATLITYFLTNSFPASSWFWQSNPMPVTVGNLVTLLTVEIVATNQSSTPCTITVQPLSTANTFQNQNNNLATFDIPANVSGYRARHRLGFNDYNVQLAVTAANSLSTNPAPTLHRISCDYTPISPSGSTV